MKWLNRLFIFQDHVQVYFSGECACLICMCLVKIIMGGYMIYISSGCVCELINCVTLGCIYDVG